MVTNGERLHQMTDEELARVVEFKDCANDLIKCPKLEQGNNRWIPCSERMPEKTGYYLVCDSTLVVDDMKGRQDVAKFVIGRHGGYWYSAILRECITHWMYLPEPPESKVQE